MFNKCVEKKKKCNLTLKHIKAKTPKYGKPKDDDCDDDSRKILKSRFTTFIKASMILRFVER